MFAGHPSARLAFVLATTLAASAAPACARDGVFTDLGPDALSALPARTGALEAPLPRRFRALEVDAPALVTLLARAPLERSPLAATAPLLISLPYPDGTDRLFRVEESPILEPGLADRFPEIRTYTAQGVDDPSASGRLSLTSLGFHAQVLSTAGTIYLDPYRRWDARYVLSYFKRDGRRAPGVTFHCDVPGEAPDEEQALEKRREEPEALRGLPVKTASGTQLRTYRLAVAGTGEYTAAVCAPNPAAVACGLNAMVVSMNRVDGVYEREVAIRMVMVANNNLIVYTDGATDPYDNGNGSLMLSQNQTNLNSVIGSANYDIGHVFSTGGGGVANLQVPCTSSKARGVTGQPSPVGDAFDIDYVAHEMGHQFGGNHSFNGTTNNCGGGNRNGSAAYEPGSGTTIMAYAGICGAENLQPHSDDTFHSKNFDEIVSFSTGATGSSCPVITATGNTVPTVNAGPAFTIPKQTPFTLTGSASDGDGDALTYLWEEFDLGSSSTAATIGNGDSDLSRPIFRSFVPLTVPSRTFPRLSDLLANTTTIGEWMSNRNRTMTFRLTARDNRAGGAGVNWAATTVTVNASAGPFQVTQPNTALSWLGNSSQTVTWNVANTTAAPVSCANVAIELSTDGGNTFSATLAASTPNDGSEAVTLPNTPTTLARVRVSCVGNVFFDLSNTNFTLTENTGAPPPSLTSINPVSGTTAGGTSITLTGTDFVNGATVLFGALAATSVTFNSSTSLTAVTPAQAAGTVDVKVTNPDTQNSTLSAAYTYRVPGKDFYTLTPCRVVDTRNAAGPLGGPALSNGTVRNFQVTGTCGIPAGAKAVAVNVTVVSPTQRGSLNVYAGGLTPPLTSTISFNFNNIRAAMSIVALDGPTAGTVDVQTTLAAAGTVHLLLDVTGYFQ